MLFTRYFSAFALCFCMVVPGAQASPAAGGDASVLSVANWNEYIDDKTIKAFEAKYGVSVHYETYVDHGEMLAAIGSGRFDIVVPDSVALGPLIAEGKVQKFDTASMQGFKDVQAILAARMRAKDAEGSHAVPYLWGRVGVAVNVEKVQEALGRKDIPNSLDVVFSPQSMPALAQCGITVIDSHMDVFAMLMHYKGRMLSNVSERRIREFGGWLDDLAPHIRKVDSEDYLDDLPAGRTCVSLVWEGDGRTLAKENPGIKFFLPEEGTALYIDSMVITASSKKKELSEKFIEFMSTPEIAKQNAAFTAYNSPSAKAVALLEADGAIDEISMTEVPMFLPPVMKPDMEELLFDIWAKFLDRVNTAAASAKAPGPGAQMAGAGSS